MVVMLEVVAMTRRTVVAVVTGAVASGLLVWLLTIRLPEPPPLPMGEPEIREIRVATVPPAVATIRARVMERDPLEEIRLATPVMSE